MCGILGVITGAQADLPVRDVRRLLDRLFILSESRGKEASGLIFRSEAGMMALKHPIPASAMIRTHEYLQLFGQLPARGAGLTLIGHSRLVTNGSQLLNENNQPVSAGKVIGVHNGIVVNADDIWARFSDLERASEVDSEALIALASHFAGECGDLGEAMRQAYWNIEGAASLALVFEDRNKAVLSTNTGSLYLLIDRARGLCVFASEAWILRQVMGTRKLAALLDGLEIRHVAPFTGLVIDLESLECEPFVFEMDPIRTAGKPGRAIPEVHIYRVTGPADQANDRLRRCVKCILPETMPFIEFDGQGVCNYCQDYVPMKRGAPEDLEKILAPHRSKDGTPDCIVGFSGGRDSSYGLHLLKKEFGMTPLAVTYDWGMVTDLARRNQARVCGNLGIEHVWISADIKTKRENVGRNLRAWLKRPALGMVPLLMAGDKQFFFHTEDQRKKAVVDLNVICVNPLEYTFFKTGFAGVRGGKYYNTNAILKYRLVAYYVSQFIRNPAYINRSLLDTAMAYAVSYFMRHDYVQLYDYVLWDEDEINKTLISEYDWEVAKDTTTTWRIGDGTASFYNYVYYKVAGFSENDTIRSNQVREGIITREQALALARRENRPRWDSIREYLRLVGVDFDCAMKVIDAIPPLTERAP